VSKADHHKSIKDLYPHLTPEELAEAERNLTAYVALALRIFERIEEDPEAYEAMCWALEARKAERDRKE
jgi:hypothetical protein